MQPTIVSRDLVRGNPSMRRRYVLVSGGVGGARMARGLAACPRVETTVIVNVADDDRVYGVEVSPDIDTVLYTLAGMEGPDGWGRASETWTTLSELARFPLDTTFRLGDRDLAMNLFRTNELAAGRPLSEVTAAAARALGVETRIIPVTDGRVRTMLRTAEAGWIDFQTYFVRRRHRDRVLEVRFDGAGDARPAPGVLEAVAAADVVVIGPSNPVLSIWPILAVPGLREAVSAARTVLAVSPLIGGRAVKGPTVEIMSALGLPATSRGILDAYGGMVTHLVVDGTDSADSEELAPAAVLSADIRISEAASSRRLAEEVVTWLS